MSETLRKLFPFLIPAAVVLYVATHLLWRGLGGHTGGRGFLRGVILALPVMAIAAWFGTAGAGGVGVAVMLTGCVLMLTLVVGACAMSDPHEGTTTGPALGLVAPLAAATFVIGFTGELQYSHALALLVLGVVLVWAKPKPVVIGEPGALHPQLLVFGAVLLLAGTIGMIFAGSQLVHLTMTPMAGPILLPLILLAAIGLLVGDVHHAQGASAAETCGGFVVTLLGFGMPLVILLSRAVAPWIHPTTAPATDLAGTPPIIMPWASWRVDAVVLLIVSLLLLPVASGRIRLARLEGLLLVIACVMYMAISVVAARV